MARYRIRVEGGTETYNAFVMPKDAKCTVLEPWLEYQFNGKDGAIFGCCAKTQEECRAKKEAWEARNRRL